jgi:hypothetical protein
MKLTKSQLRKIIKEQVRQIRENVLQADISSYNGAIIGATTSDGEDLTVGEMVADLLPKGKLPEGSNVEALSKPNEAAGPVERWDADVFAEYYGVNVQELLQIYAQEHGYQLEMPEEEAEEEEYDPSAYW